jgi:hypothetical protein
MASSFATRVRQAREALKSAGERRTRVERRLRQIPVAIERRIKDRPRQLSSLALTTTA